MFNFLFFLASSRIYRDSYSHKNRIKRNEIRKKELIDNFEEFVWIVIGFVGGGNECKRRNGIKDKFIAFCNAMCFEKFNIQKYTDIFNDIKYWKQ